MNDLILDCTILQAGPIDFWPIQEKGGRAVPACFDLLFGSGHLRLTHAAMQDWVFVTPELIRIAVPQVVNMDRCAAIVDRGILTACGEVQHELQSLSEEPSNRGADRGEIEFDDPVLQPYGHWFYGIERNGDETDGKPRVLGLSIPRINQARQRNPNLAIYTSDDLLEEGLNPVTAEIGIPRHDADYAAARSEWIEIAIESLVANIQEAVMGWPILPGEPFQNLVLIDGDIYFITLDTIDGVTWPRRRHPSKRWSSSLWRSTGSGTLISRTVSRHSAAPLCRELMSGRETEFKHPTRPSRRNSHRIRN